MAKLSTYATRALTKVAGVDVSGNVGLSAIVDLKAGTTTHTFYVRTDGSDSNDGLTNTSGGAFLTLQAAANAAISYDTGGENINIQVGAGTFAGFRVSGHMRGGIAGDTANNRIPYLYILGASASTTHIGLNDQANCCILSDYCPVILDSVDIAVPSGQTGVFLENRARLAFVNTVSFTGTATAAQCMHVESLSYIELSSCTIDVSGAFDKIFNLDTGRVALSAPTINISGPVSNFIQLANISALEISTYTINFSGAGDITGFSYVMSGNSTIEIASATTLAAACGAGGFIQTGSRTKGACDAVNCFSTTGLGSGSASAVGGSYGGIITLSPTGSPSGTGTASINVNEYNALLVGGEAPIMVSLMSGTGTWNAQATVRVTSSSAGSIVIAWTNGTGPTSLTAGQTYKICYVCNN